MAIFVGGSWPDKPARLTMSRWRPHKGARRGLDCLVEEGFIIHSNIELLDEHSHRLRVVPTCKFGAAAGQGGTPCSHNVAVTTETGIMENSISYLIDSLEVGPMTDWNMTRLWGPTPIWLRSSTFAT